MSMLADIPATVSPVNRPVAPAAYASVVRLSDKLLTYPPNAELTRLAKPSARSSRSMSASRRVAISTPVVFSKRLIVVTNITATRSPVSHGSALQGKVCSPASCQGETTDVASCGRNIQPPAWASASDEPLIGRVIEMASIAATRMLGRTKALLQRDNNACKATATDKQAPSLDRLSELLNARKLAGASRASVIT